VTRKLRLFLEYTKKLVRMPKLRHASANDYKPGKNFDFVVNIAKKFLG
jgi:hypothetical protein